MNPITFFYLTAIFLCALTLSDRPVTKSVCDANVKLVLNKIENVHKDIDEIKVMLRGSEGRNGLVKDVNDLKAKNRIYTGAVGITVGILASLVTSYLIHSFIG